LTIYSVRKVVKVYVYVCRNQMRYSVAPRGRMLIIRYLRLVSKTQFVKCPHNRPHNILFMY